MVEFLSKGVQAYRAADAALMGFAKANPLIMWSAMILFVLCVLAVLMTRRIVMFYMHAYILKQVNEIGMTLMLTSYRLVEPINRKVAVYVAWFFYMAIEWWSYPLGQYIFFLEKMFYKKGNRDLVLPFVKEWLVTKIPLIGRGLLMRHIIYSGRDYEIKKEIGSYVKYFKLIHPFHLYRVTEKLAWTRLRMWDDTYLNRGYLNILEKINFISKEEKEWFTTRPPWSLFL